jgi:hypothetical protein
MEELLTVMTCPRAAHGALSQMQLRSVSTLEKEEELFLIRPETL